jgi:hypothetical protein
MKTRIVHVRNVKKHRIKAGTDQEPTTHQNKNKNTTATATTYRQEQIFGL